MADDVLLTQTVGELDRTVGDLREEFGGFRADLSNLKTVAARIEGKLDAFQETNRAADRAQDDRINHVYSKFGAQDAVQAVAERGHSRVRGYLTSVSGGLAGALAGALVSVLGTLFHR